MKRIVIILFIFFYNFSNAQSGLLNGSGNAPDFTVVDLNGNSHNLYSYLDSGFVTVIELLSVTCGHCQMHASGTNSSYSLNGPNGNNSARFLGLEVNGFNDSASVANYVNSFNVLFPMANDVSPAVINYQINYTPTYYVIFPDRTYTTICTNCVTPTSSSTIESLLNNAINSWPPVYGCIDSTAVNYDSNANSDDGSCNYTSYTIKTLGMTFTPDTIYCNLGDTINFVLGQAHNAVEVDQSIYLSGGNLSNGGFSFGYGATGMFIPNNIQDYYYVCQPHSSGGMIGMINVSPPQIYGCIDSLAFNYDSLANTNDNSCQYPSITITNPLNMSNVFTSNVNIDFTVNDFLVGFPSSFVDGHIHYYVNGIMTPHYDITSILLPNLTNGSYEIVLRLFDNNHQPLPEDVADTITFFVNITNGCTNPLASNFDPDATINDGSCIFDVYGCTSQSAVNYNSNATIDDGSCCELSSQNNCWGCTDSLADNYDPNVVFDDGSCTYCTGIVTGLSVSDIIHDRATFNFDNMNTYDATGAQVCRVDQIRIKYRPVGTSSWSQKNIAQPTGYDAVTGICNSTQNTAKITRNLMSSTTYEWEVKVWYCDGQNSGFVAGPNFTTADDCPNVGNLTAVGANPTMATFAWDNSNGAYSFVRLKARVDSISNPTGSDFFQIGGAGVSYGIYTKNKQNMVPGETYRGQARTYCDPNGGPYRSPSWSPLVFWTQPTVRIEGGVSIANLDVYPNPSEGTFNISFSSETIQSIDIRIMNVMGEEIVSEKTEQFIGEYTKKITLENQSKGIYFLEIKTKNETINKKLFLL